MLIIVVIFHYAVRYYNEDLDNMQLYQIKNQLDFYLNFYAIRVFNLDLQFVLKTSKYNLNH